MTVAIVGGRQRLAPHYRSAAEDREVDLRIFNHAAPDLTGRVARADAIILFTDMVSHRCAKEVYKIARHRDMSLVCSHNSSISAAKRCLVEIIDSIKKPDDAHPFGPSSGQKRS